MNCNEPRGRNLNFINRTSESTCSRRCRTATLRKEVNKGHSQSANGEVKGETTKHRKVTTSLQHTPSSCSSVFFPFFMPSSPQLLIPFYPFHFLLSPSLSDLCFLSAFFPPSVSLSPTAPGGKADFLNFPSVSCNDIFIDAFPAEPD